MSGQGNTFNSEGGGFNFGAVNNSLMVNAQNTGTMTNNMPPLADKEADKEANKEAKKEGEGQTLQENATPDPNYKENRRGIHGFK